MEETRKRSIESVNKNRSRLIHKIYKNFKESIKIFYRKYLRSTTYYNHLEKRNTQKKTLEMTMMEFIRRQ